MRRTGTESVWAKWLLPSVLLQVPWAGFANYSSRGRDCYPSNADGACAGAAFTAHNDPVDTCKIDRVMLGLEKRNRVMTASDKERVAYHETGHTLVALSVEHADPVYRVSIIPRSVGAFGTHTSTPNPGTIPHGGATT